MMKIRDERDRDIQADIDRDRYRESEMFYILINKPTALDDDYVIDPIGIDTISVMHSIFMDNILL